MFRIPVDTESRRSIAYSLWMIGILLSVVRLVFVMMWCVVAGNAVSDALWVEIAMAVLSDGILGVIVVLTAFHFQSKMKKDVSFETIASSITIYTVSALSVLLFSAIIPSDLTSGAPTTFISAVVTQTIALGTYVVSIALAGFLAATLLTRQHKRTRLYLGIQVIVVLLVWLFSVLDSLESSFQGAAIVLTIIGSVVTLLNVRRLGWLAGITLDKKVRLLWLSACGAFASVVLASMLVFADDSLLTQSAHFFVRSGGVFSAVINLFAFVFFLRLFFAVVVSLPNSSVVDRRSSEVDSLAAINRLIIESANVDSLLASATFHAQKVCMAHGSWCELYGEDEVRVVGAQLIHVDYVKQLHANRDLHRLFATSDGPQFIPSLKDVFEFASVVPTIQSLILVPLIANHKRVGTLVMFSTIEYGFEQEDLRLLSAFGDSIGVALDQARLAETAVEKERLEKEFDVARKMQASLLPRTSPKVEGLDISAVTIPATQVGGDYFDFLKFPSGRYGVIIADVSGKGIPAAMYMATLKGAVLAESRVALGPRDLLSRVNATLHGSMERHTFITMLCVEYDPKTKELKVARAGHTPAIHRQNGTVSILRPNGMAIGIANEELFDKNIVEEKIKVEEGDVFLLSTDGVNERRNSSMHEIGFQPVMEMIAKLQPETAYHIVQSTLSLLETHAGDEDQHDDITIIGMLFGDRHATYGNTKLGEQDDGISNS